MKPLAAIAALFVTGLVAARWEVPPGAGRLLALVLAAGAAALLLPKDHASPR